MGVDLIVVTSQVSVDCFVLDRVVSALYATKKNAVGILCFYSLCSKPGLPFDKPNNGFAVEQCILLVASKRSGRRTRLSRSEQDELQEAWRRVLCPAIPRVTETQCSQLAQLDMQCLNGITRTQVSRITVFLSHEIIF